MTRIVRRTLAVIALMTPFAVIFVAAGIDEGWQAALVIFGWSAALLALIAASITAFIRLWVGEWWWDPNPQPPRLEPDPRDEAIQRQWDDAVRRIERATGSRGEG